MKDQCMAVLVGMALTLGACGGMDPEAPGESLASECASLNNCPVKWYDYLGNYPRARQLSWSDEMQGVAHDDYFWYFSQRNRLWMVPASRDINRSDSAWLSVGFPNEPDLERHDHFGDIDQAEGFLFVPLTGSITTYTWKWICTATCMWVQVAEKTPLQPYLLVYDAMNLRYLDHAPITGQTGGGWVAIDTFRYSNGDLLIYTSESTVNASSPIHKYRVSRAQLAAGRLVLEPVGSWYLRDDQGRLLTLEHMQGGVFDPDGCFFYTVNGYYEGTTRNTGIMVFDRNGRRVTRSTNGSGDFNFEYHHGWFTYEEPEGITFWDLDSVYSPNVSGQLHVIMLDNDATTDDLYFKHYRTGDYGTPYDPFDPSDK